MAALLKEVPESYTKASRGAARSDGLNTVSRTGSEMPEEPRKIRLLGMPISVVTEAEAVSYVIASLRTKVGGWVITPNLDQLRLFRKTADLRRMYEQAGLIVADGMPLIWASRLQRTPLPERVAGSSIISTLTAAAARSGHSIYFLGGNPGAAEQAADELKTTNPALRIAGHYCPPFGFDQNEAEMEKIRQLLKESQADIVYVGLGFPKQERLIEKLRSTLPDAWFLGIGISFSFLAGEVKRAPRWMQNIGLEWMHRMVQEPGRLFGRYVVHGIPFAIRLFCGALRTRFAQVPPLPGTP
jgi:N-acetylglucosaminyldiphosphoundecaprenol N-acetyl-beta-D-mannosaminyltransferase